MKKTAAILSFLLTLVLLFSGCQTIRPFDDQYIRALKQELPKQVEGVQSLKVEYSRPDLWFTCELDGALTNAQVRDAIAKILPLISAMAGNEDFQRDVYSKTWGKTNGVDFETYAAKKGPVPDIYVTFQIGKLSASYSYQYVARFYDRMYTSGTEGQKMQYDYYQTWSTEKLPTLPREATTK